MLHACYRVLFVFASGGEGAVTQKIGYVSEDPYTTSTLSNEENCMTLWPSIEFVISLSHQELTQSGNDCSRRAYNVLTSILKKVAM